MSATPFQRDIDGQADALRAFAASTPAPELAELLHRRYRRIVLTGMGSSHFAAVPTWRRLVAADRQAWWVDTGQLLDTPGLVTPETLLVVTSQSGASGEVVALLDRSAGGARAVIGVTNEPSSPLGKAADATLRLHSGTEATVSTKSYLNTLAAHDRLAALLLDQPAQDVDSAAAAIDGSTPPAGLAEVAAGFASAPDARLVFVGYADHAATALYAGLITKEAAKVPADGYIGGQFRHGPLELAGPGLTAVLFGDRTDADGALTRLATDLLATGSTVLSVGDLGLPDVHLVGAPVGGWLARLAHGAVVAQHLAVAVASARGVAPGEFSYGSKVTTAR
jgi:fructoselysine-6-P-deglycase FrlB-like protein